MRRVAVVGVTSSGKTTLAQELARRLGAPHIEMDALHWGAGWVQAEPELFRQRVSEALAPEAWVADGNYGEVRDLVWGRADTLVWLDYPLARALWRLIVRTFRRVGRRIVLWNGNRETLRGALFSRDSLFLYLFESHRRLRRTYPALFQQPAYRHLRVVRLRSPRQTARWLASGR
jgi:adenylate kinase family enzyme